MIRESQEMWEILIPKGRDKDHDYTVAYHQVWDKKVRQLTGGLTVYHSGEGSWISPTGKLYTERVIPVRVACTGAATMDKIAEMALDHYSQEAVMYYRIGTAYTMYK